MRLKLGQCPVSWGVEEAGDARNTSWRAYLEESASAGYHGVELGPVGYLPTDAGQLRTALVDRGLELSAGYVMEPLADREQRAAILDVTAKTAGMLVAQGAQHLVLIDDMHPGRSTVAGKSTAAVRLADEAFARLVATAHDVARMARDDFGLSVAFHPHVGTYVEFSDEIERFFDAADPELIGVCIDTGHSVYAGVDPVDLFVRYRERVRYMHLKDVDPTVHAQALESGLGFDDAVAQGIFCPIGTGMVDYGRLFAAMDAAGFAGWVAVEQDRPPAQSLPSGRSASDDASASFRFVAEGGWTEPRSEQGGSEAALADSRRPGDGV